jgi:hypothetical protein
MKRLFLFIILMSLPLTACGSNPTLDVETTVQVAIAATLTAQPTKTSVPTLRVTSTPLEPIPTFPPPPTKTPPPLTLSLETYEGQGFSFRYPANARLENVAAISPATTEIHIIGPQVWIKPGDADWFYHGQAYELIIRTYENPDGLDAESWARNYVLASWQEAREQGSPWGSFPVSEEGEIDEGKVASSAVAGEPAFWVSYFAFDSCTSAYYLTSNHQIIELSFGVYPLANQPLALIQRDVYALILDTLRLKER